MHGRKQHGAAAPHGLSLHVDVLGAKARRVGVLLTVGTLAQNGDVVVEGRGKPLGSDENRVRLLLEHQGTVENTVGAWRMRETFKKVKSQVKS